MKEIFHCLIYRTIEMKAKNIFFACLAAFSLAAFAQEEAKKLDEWNEKEARYIKDASKRFFRWIPNGWILQKATEGDLDGDKIPDAVLIIRENNPKKKGEYLTDDENPGRLIALLNTGDSYRMEAENRDLLVSQSQYGKMYHNGYEPHLSIDDGVLELVFERVRDGEMYKFRMDEYGLRLIGYEDGHTGGATGLYSGDSFNFLTGKCHHTVEFSWNAESRQEKRERAELLRYMRLKEGKSWKNIKRNKRIYIDNNIRKLMEEVSC